MSYLDDLTEHERKHPAKEQRPFAKKFILERKLEPPDKLRDYRDQRWNRPDGPGSYEPDFT